jgi:hypothetical protein
MGYAQKVSLSVTQHRKVYYPNSLRWIIKNMQKSHFESLEMGGHYFYLRMGSATPKRQRTYSPGEQTPHHTLALKTDSFLFQALDFHSGKYPYFLSYARRRVGW